MTAAHIINVIAMYIKVGWGGFSVIGTTLTPPSPSRSTLPAKMDLDDGMAFGRFHTYSPGHLPPNLPHTPGPKAASQARPPGSHARQKSFCPTGGEALQNPASPKPPSNQAANAQRQMSAQELWFTQHTSCRFVWRPSQINRGPTGRLLAQFYHFSWLRVHLSFKHGSSCPPGDIFHGGII